MGSSKDPRYSLAYTAVPVWIGMFRINLSGDPHTDHCRDMCFAQRIRHNAFFGNLNIMKWLIDDLYELIEFDEEYFDFFDLYYLLRTPHKVSFIYEDNEQSLESVMEGNECTVCFNGKWFHSRDDFFKDACIGNTKLTAIYDKLYGFEVKD